MERTTGSRRVGHLSVRPNGGVVCVGREGTWFAAFGAFSIRKREVASVVELLECGFVL